MNSLFCLTVANQRATSWVLHWTGGSIKTGVDEQSSTRAARGQVFSPVSISFGSITEPVLHDLEVELMWVTWRRRVPLRQTGRQAYLGLRLILECRDSALQKNKQTKKHLDPTDLPWQTGSEGQRWAMLDRSNKHLYKTVFFLNHTSQISSVNPHTHSQQ